MVQLDFRLHMFIYFWSCLQRKSILEGPGCVSKQLFKRDIILCCCVPDVQVHRTQASHVQIKGHLFKCPSYYGENALLEPISLYWVDTQGFKKSHLFFC